MTNFTFMPADDIRDGIFNVEKIDRKTIALETNCQLYSVLVAMRPYLTVLPAKQLQTRFRTDRPAGTRFRTA